MKSLKKPTVTVGIPACNEENNIKNLLTEILKQNQRYYVLKNIIVICDGCTDNTVVRVKEIAQKNKLITIIDDKKRRGKAYRLNQLYALNKSDFLVSFDADILPASKYVIDNLIKNFDESVGIVGGNNLPVKAKTTVEEFINTWTRVWYETRKDVNNGNHIHNIRGCIMAIRGSLVKKIRIPKKITSESQYLYFSAKKNGLSFHFAKDAVVLFRSPDNVHDYFLQVNRTNGERVLLMKMFGENIINEYTIPFQYKVRALAKMVVRDPVSLFGGGAFFSFMKLFPKKQNSFEKEGVWKLIESTKKGISQKEIAFK